MSHAHHSKTQKIHVTTDTWISYIETGIVFLVAILFAFVVLAVSADVFAGDWRKIRFGELFPAASFAVFVTLVYIVYPSRMEHKSHHLLLGGFSLLALTWLLMLPADKYLVTFPTEIGFHDLSIILEPFFFAGGILLILSGFTMFVKERL